MPGMDNLTLGQRLRKEREEQAVSRQELARYMGIAPTTLADLENDASKSTTKLHLAAERLRVSARWLETGRGVKAPAAVEDEWPNILAYRQAAALGDGAVPDEYAETHKLKFRADSLTRKQLRAQSLGVIYGKGDSMLPRIQSGDAILFDTSDVKPRDGKLYVISYGGELFAKQLSLLGDRWFIESLNKDDPKWRKPTPIDDHRGFTIHGRIRWIGSWEN